MDRFARAEAPLLIPPAALAPLIGPGQVAPRYDGRSLANLPPTIGALLGVQEGWAAPPLVPELQQGWGGRYDRVVMLLLDGVGWRRLWSHVARHDPRFPEFLAERGATALPITSVSPSTTAVATTTLWCNGAAPAEHGLLGFSALLPGPGLVANLLFWHPVEGPHGSGSLESLGLLPEAFLPVPGIAQVLANAGLSTTALMPADIYRSPLSRLQMRGAKVVGSYGAPDLWYQIERWLAEGPEAGYLYAYDPRIDLVSHRDGPESPAWPHFWADFRGHLDRLLERLPARARRRTLLLISADHGHALTPPTQRTLLSSHPDLERCLAHIAGGEPRHSYLYLRPGQESAADDYLQRHLAERFHIITGRAAIDGGLYGPPARRHPEAARRIGDRVLLARGGAMLWSADPDQVVLGMHGSLEPEEMIVPLIALPLEG